MNRKRFVITLIALLALLLTTSGATGQGPDSEGEAHPRGDVSIAGTVNSRISYQGRLLEDDAPVTGSRDMHFRLYSDSSCTVQVGNDIVKNDVAVADGLFSVELDVSHGSFDGQELWLELDVGGTAIGCQEILPVPYALSLRPGAMINDSASIIYLNRSRMQLPSLAQHKYGIEAEVDGSYNYAYGVYGSATSITAYGVYGSAHGNTAYGVYGQSETDSIAARGVYGTALYTGVEGHATATSGEASGVYGQTDSSSDYAQGVRGYASASSGETYGVSGQTDSSTFGTAGVYGYTSAISGVTSGVYGEAVSASGRGVYGAAPNYGLLGDATASDGVTFGVLGRSYSPSGVGVYGMSLSGGTGVYAESDSGVGMHAVSNSDTAVWAQTSGGIAAVDARNTGGGRGVYAESAGPGGGGAAVYAQANHADGIALWGNSNSTDSTLVLRNDGTGDLIRGFNHDVWAFRVENDGRTTVSVLAITGGSDLSEQFDVTAAEGEVTPGLVVCIDVDHPGKLLVCNGAYDRTVAGIVSGAGGIEPGMVMGQQGSLADGAYPVALTGRVYVWADASAGPIQPGDLLTTSDTLGHVMKVSDYTQAQGAIIGKAMSSLDQGQGLILILVSLQ